MILQSGLFPDAEIRMFEFMFVGLPKLPVFGDRTHVKICIRLMFLNFANCLPARMPCNDTDPLAIHRLHGLHAMAMCVCIDGARWIATSLGGEGIMSETS